MNNKIQEDFGVEFVYSQEDTNFKESVQETIEAVLKADPWNEIVDVKYYPARHIPEVIPQDCAMILWKRRSPEESTEYRHKELVDALEEITKAIYETD